MIRKQKIANLYVIKIFIMTQYSNNAQNAEKIAFSALNSKDFVLCVRMIFLIIKDTVKKTVRIMVSTIINLECVRVVRRIVRNAEILTLKMEKFCKFVWIALMDLFFIGVLA
jgi:hypothetical protein